MGKENQQSYLSQAIKMFLFITCIAFGILLLDSTHPDKKWIWFFSRLLLWSILLWVIWIISALIKAKWWVADVNTMFNLITDIHQQWSKNFWTTDWWSTNENIIKNQQIHEKIPTLLYTAYETIIAYEVSEQKTLNEFSFYTQFLHTKNTRRSKNGNSRYTSNKAIYLTYSRQTQFPSIESYLHIIPDKTDSLKARVIKYSAWPLLLFWWAIYILEDKAYDLFHFVSEKFGVNEPILIGVIVFLSSYIWSIIRNKLHQKNKIRLEDKQIEQLIDLKSNDPIFARQICNPAFIETLHSSLKSEELFKRTEIYIDCKEQKIVIKLDYLKKKEILSLANFTSRKDDFSRQNEWKKREIFFLELIKSLQLTHAMRVASANIQTIKE